MAEELIVRFIDSQYVSMKPGETSEKNLLEKCDGCIFDGRTGCVEAYEQHILRGQAYCMTHESIWRAHVLDRDKKERRKLNGI